MASTSCRTSDSLRRFCGRIQCAEWLDYPDAVWGTIPIASRRAREPSHLLVFQEAPDGGDRRLSLGFLALGYEMYLFRIASLAYQPLPYTFSTVLCLYLLLWSIGVLLARWIKADFSLIFVLTASALVFVPQLYYYQFLGGNVILFSAIYTLPCVGFGLLFGQLVSRVAVHWGNDVGRFYGLNTLGSCFGILATVLIGYEFYYGCRLGHCIGLPRAFGVLAMEDINSSNADLGRRSVLVLSGRELGLW